MYLTISVFHLYLFKETILLFEEELVLTSQCAEITIDLRFGARVKGPEW